MGLEAADAGHARESLSEGGDHVHLREKVPGLAAGLRAEMRRRPKIAAQFSANGKFREINRGNETKSAPCW